MHLKFGYVGAKLVSIKTCQANLFMLPVPLRVSALIVFIHLGVFDVEQQNKRTIQGWFDCCNYENMLLLETLGFKENSPSLNSFQQSTF